MSRTTGCADPYRDKAAHYMTQARVVRASIDGCKPSMRPQVTALVSTYVRLAQYANHLSIRLRKENAIVESG